MDGIANVARQQQSQLGAQEANGRASTQIQQAQQIQKMQSEKQDVVKEMQDSASKTSQKINSKEQVQDLVDQLNKALSPMSTSLKFGFDNRDEVFFVSVIESDTNKIIRRWPAEKAMEFLPKMQEVTGILFDSKG
ncbi:MAG: flagellar protein FlaG [Epsilonproteobacteria bacterium]|nr:flagellar protein FlaG [Campylobacterota bacterium]